MVITAVLCLSLLGFGASASLASGQTCYNTAGDTVECPGSSGSKTSHSAVYKDNGDGTITDLRTKYMWQKESDGIGKTWNEGKAYCEGLELGGHSGWRLPTNDELKTIADYGRSSNVINPAFTCHPGDYWTSTPNVHTKDYSLTVGFFGGSNMAQPQSNKQFARCVTVEKRDK